MNTELDFLAGFIALMLVVGGIVTIMYVLAKGIEYLAGRYDSYKRAKLSKLPVLVVRNIR
jgi:hypothetical protein